MSPKRVVDGDALYRSAKLREIRPPEFRSEFANLIPLAMANGVFECCPDMIWSTVYSFNRPDWDRDMVGRLLDEYERVKLLFRWRTKGKVWGYWVGIEKPGRLPPASRRGERHEKLGPEPPKDELEAFINGYPMATHSVPNGSVGLGFGSCLGLGEGVGRTSTPNQQPPLPLLSSTPNLSGQVEVQLAEIEDHLLKHHDIVFKPASRDGGQKSAKETVLALLNSGVPVKDIQQAVQYLPLDHENNPSFAFRDHIEKAVRRLHKSREEAEQSRATLARYIELEQESHQREENQRLAREQAEAELIEDELPSPMPELGFAS